MFFSESCADHPSLHSFPTRRSSDLKIDEAHLVEVADIVAREGVAVVDGKAARAQMPAAVAEKLLRSEEHTSELQSQSNLVCRLLLEKKNIHRLTGEDSQFDKF